MTFGIATGAFLEQRDDWDASISRAVAGGWPFLELTAVTEELLDTLRDFLERERDRDRLAGFARVSLHAPIVVRTSVEAVVHELGRLSGEPDLVLHPDVYAHEPSVGRLGRRLVFENMDVQQAFGRTVTDLQSVFEQHPEAGFCLDVAHVWTNDPSLRLGHDLIDAFGGRLRQLHVSGIEPDGTHRPTTAADLDLYGQLLDRCRHVPWLLEAELQEAA
jgi:endonuclease IV